MSEITNMMLFTPAYSIVYSIVKLCKGFPQEPMGIQFVGMPGINARAGNSVKANMSFCVSWLALGYESKTLKEALV